MSEKQGCSTIVVIMIALVALVLGGVAGAGGVYGYLQTEGVEVGTVPTVPADTPTVTAPTAAQNDYALLYPIEESLRIEGAIPAKVVKNHIKDKRYEMRKCYQAAFETNPSLKGEMSLQFTVSGDTGKVIAAVERHTDIGDKNVRECLLKEIKSWTLNAKVKGNSVVKFDVLMIPISSAAGEL